MSKELPPWDTMPTPTLMEQAWDLAKKELKRDLDSNVARCILALLWRLKAAEEWIAGQNRATP